jgi:hypothetical protein
MSTFPAKSIHQNHFAGGAEPTEGNKEVRSQKRPSFEDHIVGTSASGRSSVFNYTLAEQPPERTADRHAVAAVIRQSWLQSQAGVRLPHDSVETKTRIPTPMLIRSSSSISGVDTLLIGGAIVAGLIYIFAFDSSPPDIGQASALMTTFSEMPSHIPAPSPQSLPPLIESRGIKAMIEAEYEFQTPSLHVSTRSESRLNGSDVATLQSTFDSGTTKTRSIVVAARPLLEASPPNAGTMPAKEWRSVPVKPSIDRSRKPPQRVAGVPEPTDLIMQVEQPASQIVHEMAQAVPLPRPSPKLRPKAATTAPVQTSSLSPLRHDGDVLDPFSSVPAAIPKVTAAAARSRAPASAAVPTTAPLADGLNPVASSDSAEPPTASNWWRRLLALLQPG